MRKSWKTWMMQIMELPAVEAIHPPAEAAAREVTRIAARTMVRGMTRAAEIPAAVRMGRIIQMEVPAETGLKAGVPAEAEIPKAEVPAEAGAPKAGVPAEAEIPKTEIPVEAETPKAEVPEEAETPKAEIPAEAGTKVGVPAEAQPKVEIPAEAGAPKAEVPAEAGAPRAEAPAEVQPKAATPAEVHLQMEIPAAVPRMQVQSLVPQRIQESPACPV